MPGSVFFSELLSLLLFVTSIWRSVLLMNVRLSSFSDIFRLLRETFLLIFPMGYLEFLINFWLATTVLLPAFLFLAGVLLSRSSELSRWIISVLWRGLLRFISLIFLFVLARLLYSKTFTFLVFTALFQTCFSELSGFFLRWTCMDRLILVSSEFRFD